MDILLRRGEGTTREVPTCVLVGLVGLWSDSKVDIDESFNMEWSPSRRESRDILSEQFTLALPGQDDFRAEGFDLELICRRTSLGLDGQLSSAPHRHFLGIFILLALSETNSTFDRPSNLTMKQDRASGDDMMDDGADGFDEREVKRAKNGTKISLSSAGVNGA